MNLMYWLIGGLIVAILATVIAFLATQSLKAAMILTWAPVAVGGSYAIGKAKGRNQ